MGALLGENVFSFSKKTQAKPAEETASPFFGVIVPTQPFDLSTNHPIDLRSVSERLVFSTARAG
jgi:hypothetical protein